MEIEVSEDIAQNIARAARDLGMSRKEVIARAIKLYLRNLKDFEELQREINLWERASIEDSSNFSEKYSL